LSGSTDSAPKGTQARIDRVRMPYALERGMGWRARIGLIVLSSDYSMEPEFARVLALPGVAVYHSRIENDDDINPESLAQMRERICASTALITPQGALDVVAFGCTSASTVIGPAAVHDLIRQVRPGVACTTPIESVAVALNVLGAKKIALLTPYVAAINHQMRAYLLAAGFDVPVMGSWNIPDDNEVAMLSADSVAQAVCELGHEDDVEAVFVSCTNVPLVEQIQELEQTIGKPVISSNSATAWHCLRLAGVDDRIDGYGRLFEMPLASEQ
jgi:maleate isomerase